MQHRHHPSLATVLLLAFFTSAPGLHAALNIPGADGSDGALIITENTQIDLSLATTGVWSNVSAVPGQGVYDPEKWAVVFKYTSVNVASNATVTFKNHPSRAPVVWLVQNDVTIDGMVSLNGSWSVGSPRLSEPGPGGFRGGMGSFVDGMPSGAGFGPGGGHWGNYGGSYGTIGQNQSDHTRYGNPSLIPLIGGSGGGGHSYGPSGGAGGGAILIACGGTIAVHGNLRANGGGTSQGGTGSGGGIRLVSDTMEGRGTIQAVGSSEGYDGGQGRIRLERVTNASDFAVIPDPSIVTLAAAASPLVWLPSEGPLARIVSIGGAPVPSDPRAAFGSIAPDVTIPETTSTEILIETTNVESASAVKVRVTPRGGASSYLFRTASLVQTNNVDPLVLLWSAQVPAQLGYSAAQVQVIRP